MSTTATAPRSIKSKKNLRKNMKIMDKDYHLVNSKTKESLTVHPPKSMLPGMNSDGKQPKDENGRWIRVFSVEDSNHVKSFNRKRTVILRHLPGEVAYHEDEDGQTWTLVPIEGVHASKPRKVKKGVRARSTTRVKQATGKQRSPGRPRGAKNKTTKESKSPKVAEASTEATKPKADSEPIEVQIPK